MSENQKISKKLSIAIPTYNRLAYLKECIKSILNQKFQDFSIFVFDNASDEPVEEELKKFNDERIRFIGNDKNIGPAGNITRIFNYPFNSEYLVIFHDDNLMHSRMLELQTSFLNTNKDIVFVVSKLNRVSDKNTHTFKSFSDSTIKYIVYRNNYEFTKAILSWLEYAFDSAMYKVEFIRGGRMKFDKFSDFADIAFLMEISQKGPCAIINASLVNYRMHSGQDWRVPKKNYEEGAINILSFCRENLPTVLNKEDEKLFRRYSLNFLIRSYADINNGFSDFLKFIKKCHQKKLIKYKDFKYIDAHGIISTISIILRNKKIIDAARTFKDFLKK